MPSPRRGRSATPEQATTAPPPNQPPLVEARGITKGYGEGNIRVDALLGVDFAIHRGERVAVVGPSGCGKTTLLNCLAGLERPDAGHVLVDGADLWGLGEDARTRLRARRMGFVFQSFNLLPVLSAEENVELPLLVTGVSAREARSRARAALGRVGLAERTRHLPGELSGGEQQRVAVARSLVNAPAVVWADEPTGNLDTATSGRVVDLIVELNEETGTAFVLVTHDPAVAARCHRIVHMAAGDVVAGKGEPAAPAPRRRPRGAGGTKRS